MKFTKIIALALLAVMALSLVACSAYGTIEKNLEAIGYIEVEGEDGTAKTITQELEEGNLSCTVHLLTEEGAFGVQKKVIILEFASDKELTEAIETSGTLSGIIQDAQKSQIVRDNCVLVILPSAMLDTSEIINAFNEGKK